jgi:hypothetical protein
MTPEQLIERFRSDVADTAKPYLWSVDEVEEFVVEAEREFYRLIGGIRDATTDVTQLALTAGEAAVPYDESILAIHSARLASTGARVHMLSYDDVFGDTNVQLPFSLSTINDTGNVCAVVKGLDDNQLRVIHVPAVDDVLMLVVDRLPTDDPLEVGEFTANKIHHRQFLHWMKHLAYDKQDADSFDKGKADDFGARFERYCGQVKLELERQRHKPRLIAYGGI